MIKFQLKDIPLIGKYLISNKTINTNKDELNTMDNNYDIAFKYNSSQDCFGNSGSFVFPSKLNIFFGSSSVKYAISNLVGITINL